MKDTESAYLAGLFDGDGCVSVNTHLKTGYGSLQCLLTTTDIPITGYLKSTFGGSVNMLKRRKETWRDQYMWCIHASTAVEFLHLLLPYLKIKREQALVGIQYQSLLTRNGNRHKISPADRKLRLELCQRLKELKDDNRRV